MVVVDDVRVEQQIGIIGRLPGTVPPMKSIVGIMIMVNELLLEAKAGVVTVEEEACL